MNRDERNEYHRRWRANNPESARASVRKYKRSRKGQTTALARNLRSKYGLSLTQYEDLLREQENRCPVCQREFVGRIKACVDHNHETGQIRGLLCRSCNASIGGMRDDIKMLVTAASYLQRTDRELLIHPLAVIGSAPEHRDFYRDPSARAHLPEIHPTARINAYATVDSGTSRPTRIGKNALLLAKVHVGHDSIVGDGCEIAVGTVLSGWVELGENVRVGVGACFKPRIKVGDGAQIGAGAVVVRNVPAGEIWVGNPAHEIGTRPEHDTWAEWYNHSRAIDVLRDAMDAEGIA